VRRSGLPSLRCRLVTERATAWCRCVFSFICSQNNNIGRITKMIDALCARYGASSSSSRLDVTSRRSQFFSMDVAHRVRLDDWTVFSGDALGEVEGQPQHAFPTVERIANIPEQELRELGFGCGDGLALQLAGARWVSDWIDFHRTATVRGSCRPQRGRCWRRARAG
jgi:hypothetical protein